MGGGHLAGDGRLAVDFISSAQIGQWLTVESDVIKTGSTICFAQSFVIADDVVIARANGTFRVVPKKRGKPSLPARHARTRVPGISSGVQKRGCRDQARNDG